VYTGFDEIVIRLLRSGDTHDTVSTTQSLYLVTDDTTDLLYTFEFEGIFIFVVDVQKEVIGWCLLLHQIHLFFVLHGFHVLFTEFVKLVEWNGKNPTIHEDM
jgi:hypothetical protein